MLCRESTALLLFMRPFEYVGPTVKLDAIVDNKEIEQNTTIQGFRHNLIVLIFPYTRLTLFGIVEGNFVMHERMKVSGWLEVASF
jgi:hypothetical protein